MSSRHSYTKTSDVSDALISLAERPAERVNTRTFIEAIFSSIRAAREQQHTFEAIAQVISNRLGYAISAKTVSKYYNAILADSQRGKKARNTRPALSTQNKPQLEQPTSSKPTQHPDSDRQLNQETSTEGGAEKAIGDRSEVSVNTKTAKKPVLSSGQRCDVTHLFHHY